MSTLKFVYNDQIYKAAGLPESFSALTNLLRIILKNNLPKSYFLQYQDTEGDRVMLAGEEDYQAMLATELPQDQNKSVRVFVNPKDLPPNVSDKDNSVCNNTAGVSQTSNIQRNDQQGRVNPGNKNPDNFEINDEEQSQTEEFSRDELKNDRRSDFGKEEFKKQKKLIRKEFKHQKRLHKEEILKNAITEVLYDNLPNMAKVIGSYVKDPSINLEETVEKIRPKINQNIEEPPQESQPSFDCFTKRPIPLFKILLGHYQNLPEERKRGINYILGGIPEQMLGKMNDNENDKERGGRDDYWAKKNPFNSEKPQCQFGLSQHQHHEGKGKGNEYHYKFHDKKWRGEGKYKEEWNSGYDEGKKGKDKWRAKEESSNFANEYSVELVKEVGSVPNKVTVNDETIYKTITIRNNGTVEWPKSALLIPRGEVRSQTVRLSNVKPGIEFSPVLTLKNPGKPGNYISDWKLGYKDEQGKTIYTGASVKVELNVSPAEDEKKTVSQEVVRKKAEELLKIFPQVDFDYLLEIINQTPNLSLDELADTYLR